MNINEFLLKYRQDSRPIEEIISLWSAKTLTDKFLNQKVGEGIILADLLLGDGIFDKNSLLLSKVSIESIEAFKNLMGEKADDISKVRELIVEKFVDGDSSVSGLISKIQGQIGEDIFKSTFANVELAESGSQAVWDAARITDSGTQYVQVKIYKDPSQVINKIKETNEKVSSVEIIGIENEVVTSVDFAVNEDIYEDVLKSASAEGVSNKIIKIPATQEEIRKRLSDDMATINDTNDLDLFFEDFFGIVGNATILHTAVNAFFYLKGQKDLESMIRDSAYSTAISSVGIGASMTTSVAVEAIIVEFGSAVALLGGPLGTALVFGVGIGARGITSRVFYRRHIVTVMTKTNADLKDLALRLR